MKHSATPKRVAIYGGGPSLRVAPFPKDWEKWSVGSLELVLKDKVNLFFCMHEMQYIDGCINLDIYPLDDIVKKYGSRYFTNSIAYMIAYAMHHGYDEVALYGVDLNQGSEYTFQRPCVAYWAGRAEGQGIKVIWDKLETPFLYGYEGEEMEKMIKILEEKKDMAAAEFQASSGRERDQWAGYLLAISKIMQEVR